MRGTKLSGMFVPHITPFSHDGELDEAALRTCVQFWMESELSGLIPCASNGEAPKLSREERAKVIGTVIDEVNGKAQVIAGTGSISTKETILLTRDAKDLGVDAALVVTPFYYKVSNRELYGHYKALSEAVDLPIILYSAPKFTGYSLEPSAISRLVSEDQNIVGVKDSGGNLGNIVEIARLVGDKISVLAGTADVTLPTLMLGGHGAVIAVANVVPKMCSDLYEAFKRGDYEKARIQQRHISYLNDILVRAHNQLSAIKEALSLLGLPSGNPRRPTLRLKDTEKEEIRKVLETVSRSK